MERSQVLAENVATYVRGSLAIKPNTVSEISVRFNTASFTVESPDGKRVLVSVETVNYPDAAEELK